MVRTDEVRGNFDTSRSWRWEPTAEDRFLQKLASRRRDRSPITTASHPLADTEWPAFRGPDRNGVQEGIVFGEDWQTQPPKENWRVRIGLGRSSFSVAGNRLFTQEQRGEGEVVVYYDANSGTKIWVHEYRSRF